MNNNDGPIYSILSGKPGTVLMYYVETMLYFHNNGCADNPADRTNDFNTMTTWFNNMKSWMQSNGWDSVTTEITASTLIQQGPEPGTQEAMDCGGDPWTCCDIWSPVIAQIYGKPQDGKVMQTPRFYDYDYIAFTNNSLDMSGAISGSFSKGTNNASGYIDPVDGWWLTSTFYMPKCV